MIAAPTDAAWSRSGISLVAHPLAAYNHFRARVGWAAHAQWLVGDIWAAERQAAARQSRNMFESDPASGTSLRLRQLDRLVVGVEELKSRYHKEKLRVACVEWGSRLDANQLREGG